MTSNTPTHAHKQYHISQTSSTLTNRKANSYTPTPHNKCKLFETFLMLLSAKLGLQKLLVLISSSRSCFWSISFSFLLFQWGQKLPKAAASKCHFKSFLSNTTTATKATTATATITTITKMWLFWQYSSSSNKNIFSTFTFSSEKRISPGTFAASVCCFRVKVIKTCQSDRMG